MSIQSSRNPGTGTTSVDMIRLSTFVSGQWIFEDGYRRGGK
jgi:hypothetical protein